jgi:hypothetical protein
MSHSSKDIRSRVVGELERLESLDDTKRGDLVRCTWIKSLEHLPIKDSSLRKSELSDDRVPSENSPASPRIVMILVSDTTDFNRANADLELWMTVFSSQESKQQIKLLKNLTNCSIYKIRPNLP